MSIETEADPGALRIVRNTDDRPEVKITHEDSDVADEAAKHLGRDGEIYKRGGELVHVITPAPTTPGAKVMPQIRSLPLPTLRVRLAQCARFMKFVQSDRVWKRTPPPDKIVQAVFARGTWDHVRPLVGVISAPTMRADGSILQRPGYDEASGLLLIPNASYIEVPDAPSLEDARQAADAILDVVCDFPFATPHDRSAWLAAFLTLLARPAFDGPAPLFAVDANTRGSGKSRLVDAACVAAFGGPAARSTLSTQDEELRKQITSLLSEGTAAVLLDNVKTGGRVGGPALDALLTSTVWKDRLLGKSSTLTLPALATWFMTGNNVRLIGDLPRRTLRIRLESPLEDPEKREGFKHGAGDELLRYVERRRWILVTQGLTILRAHFLAKRPNAASWGSFEGWSRTIAGAIQWVGLPDPLAARATEDNSSDEDRVWLDAVLAMLGDYGRPVTARELVAELYPPGRYEGEAPPDIFPTYPAAREALEAATSAKGVPNALHVGSAFKRWQGRIVGGRSLRGELDRHAKIQRWTVVKHG